MRWSLDTYCKKMFDRFSLVFIIIGITNRHYLLDILFTSTIIGDCFEI